MEPISKTLKFFFELAKTQAIMSRRFDSRLGGLSLNEFVILFRLSESTDGKMRRVDLAEKVGLTASGVTRLLLPMEKIGLVKRELDERDGRVSFVALAPGGKRKLAETVERAELLVEETVPYGNVGKLEELSVLLCELGKGG